MSHDKYIKENVIKNAVVVLIAAVLYPVIAKSLEQIKIEQTNDFLLIISILLVTVCFGNFAFTYEKSRFKAKGGKFLSYGTTGILLLLTLLLLECMIVTIKIVYPFLFNLILGFSIMLYAGIIMYDFWDLMRAEK